MTTSKKMVFGIGDYTATWLDGGPMVRLRATGILPCSNYSAQLEKRPERVVPPNWNMVFYVEDSCEKRLKTFSVEALMLNGSGAKAIVVHDALGEQMVPIHSSLPTVASGDDRFIVYALLPRPEKGHHGCIVVPEDVAVTANRYRAFGPATQEECEEFASATCAAKSSLVVAGGEVPWPIIA